MREVSYKDLFNNMHCDLSIFFEDDFTFPTEFDINAILYRLVRMDVQTILEPMMNKLREIDLSFASSIQEFIDEFQKWDNLIDNWDNVVKDDIDNAISVIQAKSDDAFAAISSKREIEEPSDLEGVKSILRRFGAFCVIPPAYTNLFEEYILSDRTWKPFIVYSNYSADVNYEIKEMISCLSNQSPVICCYIDNNLCGENKAEQIINDLENLNNEKAVHFIGAVVTSRDPFSKITNSIFIDSVLKNDLNSQLKSALLRSVYHYLLHSLKEQYINSITDAFNKAGSHRNIALYLSEMAEIEGIGNYALFVEWIKGLTEYYSSRCENIAKMIPIANLIERQSELDESVEGLEDLSDLSDYNTFEAFDYRVNDYYLPVEPGDIFVTDTNEIYILVGQACDMAMSESRSRRNGLCEMVKATFETDTDANKIAKDQKNMWINHFKLGETYGKLKIDYQKRFFVENEILSLSSYHCDGSCKIGTNDNKYNPLLQGYQINYYDRLKAFFDSIVTLKENCPVASETILANESIAWICSLLDYTNENGQMIYPLKRVCRLKEKHLIYLYKLFLEYRGRIPFNTISLNRTITRQMEFRYSSDVYSYNVDIVLNRSTGEIKSTWPCIISNATVLDLLGKILPSATVKEERNNYVIEEKELSILLSDGKKLKFTKKTSKSITVTIER